MRDYAPVLPSRRREGLGVGLLLQCETDRLDHPFDICPHSVVGKVQNTIALCVEDGIAPDIALRSYIVRVPVDLDDEHMLAAQEIGEERSYLHLATEFRTDLRI